VSAPWGDGDEVRDRIFAERQHGIVTTPRGVQFVEVRWPDGSTSRMRRETADQRLLLQDDWLDFFRLYPREDV
jgi:hypothetical protein